MSVSLDDGSRPRRARLVQWFRNAHVGPLRGIGLWGSAAVVLAYLAVSIPQWGEPYVIDEAVFPYVADGIVKHGAPFFYNGETRPNDLGLWHPPLYDYLLALQVLVFGMSTFAVRAFGAVCVIASFFVLTLALRRIAPELKQYGYVVLAALVLLNPLVLSDALVPDIDGTLGIVLIAFALWISALVVQRPLSPRLVVGVFVFATFAVSTKFILAGIVAVIVGVAALLAPEQRWRKVVAVVAAFAAGAAVSLGLLFGLGALLKFDATGPFVYLFGSLGTRAPGRSGLSGTIFNLIVGPGANLVWIGPAIITCGIIAFIVILVRHPLGVSRRMIGLAVISSIGIMIGYSYITGSPYGFPKYTNIVVPGLALTLAALLTTLPEIPVATGRRRAIVRWAGAAYGVVLILATVATVLAARRYESDHVRKIRELVALGAVDVVGILVATALLAIVVFGRPPEAGRGIRRLRLPLAVGIVAALIGAPIMVQTGSSLVNALSTSATRYYYGERGMSEFLARADQIIPPGTKIIAAKDIGLQLKRPFYEDAFFLPLSPSKLRADLTEMKAEYLVTRNLHDYSEVVYPKQYAVLRDFYTPILAGPDSDFTLWQLK